MDHHDMLNDINAMLIIAEPPLAADCCIYKVPFAIRKLNNDAYTPRVISIGPFHHHHPRLQNMKRHKVIFFRAFLQHTKATIQSLIHYIDSIIPKFRSCYSETLEFTNQELGKLILIDSVFIIQLFWSSYHKQQHAFLLKPYLFSDVSLDLLLLENQLPFFVVEQIFNISFSAATHIPSLGADTTIPSFRKLTFDYFTDFNKSNLLYDSSNIHIRHFTDLIRIFHWQDPSGRLPNIVPQPMKHFHSVTELLEAGVRFKPSTGSKCLLDLRFLGGVLEIPQLKVEYLTEILFRNMVALEQCHYPNESYITDYILILDFLINTKKDVDLLVQKGILVNWLGDSESVAKLVNSLGKNVAYSNSSYNNSVLLKNLDDFYNNRWHKWKATLRRDYCNTPWQTAASVAAILLLILSLLQSVCSVLQVVQR